MKLNESEGKWIKVDESELNWMKVDKVDERGRK